MRKFIATAGVVITLLCTAGCNSRQSTPNTSSIPAESTTASTTSISKSGTKQPSSTQSSSDASPKNTNVTTNPDTSSTDAPSVSDNISITTEKPRIDSLDKLNFYAVKQALAKSQSTALCSSFEKPTITTLSTQTDWRVLRLANTNMQADSTFTITMYSYFTVTLNDTHGFLANKLGSTGAVEVVITKNNFHNMITFKKGERYYSCFQTTETEKAMSFSTHKYVSGYQLVENPARENYEFTVYFENDRVLGINCLPFSDNTQSQYVEDDIRLSDSFSFVLYQKQTFTAAQLEGLFAFNSAFVDNGVVLEDGTVLFGEASVSNTALAFKTHNGESVITNHHIKKIAALHTDRFGYCIRLELTGGVTLADTVSVDFYLNGKKDRELTLQQEGAFVYITDLDNKSRMSDVFYKLTAADQNKRIGKILDYNDFVRETSKRIDLENYNLTSGSDGDLSGDGYSSAVYTYDIKTEKSISHKVSNYEVTVDDITFTLPIKVSDFLSLGFTIKEKVFDRPSSSGGALFCSPSGKSFDTYIMNFYGDSTDFNSCYITQVCFSAYDRSTPDLLISPTRPNFEILEGINKDSTFDDVISRLGEPNTIMLYTYSYPRFNRKDCRIQLYYDIATPSLPNGSLVFNIEPFLNSDVPTDFLDGTSFSLQ